MGKTHHYQVDLSWTGNLGNGTTGYTAYSRQHEIAALGKPPIPGSSDPAFRGDNTRYNPEELLVASLSACHMLWYLHLCATNSVVVLKYDESASGTMTESENGSGSFTEVILKPRVVISEPSMTAQANELHKKAAEMCYIANSCKFPVRHEPTCISNTV